MGQRPKELTPHRSPQDYWGAELRSWRTHRDLRLAAFSRLVHLDGSYVAKVERGERAPSAEFAAACDQALNAGGALVRLHEHLFTQGAGLVTESVATHVHVANHEAHVASSTGNVALDAGTAAPWEMGGEITVPARTPDGRIIFVSVSRRLFLRGIGTAAVGSVVAAAAPPRVSAFSRAADISPIAHFREMRKVLIDSDNLFGPRGVLPAVHEQLAVLQELRRASRGTDHQQLVRLQTQYAEFAGWLHQDVGDHRAAQYWLDRALSWSHMSRETETTAFIMARKSQLAADMDDPAEAIDAGETAVAMARPNSHIAAIAATFAAHGHALNGDHMACMRGYDTAHDLLGNMERDPESPWGLFLDASYIDVHRAHSLHALGDHQAAAEGFQAAIAALDHGFHRDEGVYLAREALAYAGGRDAEQAAQVGMQALAISAETGSGRILNELARLDNDLAQWRTVPAVREFQDTLAGLLPGQVQPHFPSS